MARHMLAATRKDKLFDEVAAQVEELFGLDAGALRFGENFGNVVMARRLSWYVLYMRWNYSYPQIEERTGYDHTTIRTGVIAISDTLKRDRDLQQKAKALGV